jgi:hypothetical protein
MDHLNSADDLEDMEIVNSWLDWTMSLSQHFNHDDNAQLTAMITDIRKHINGDFDAILFTSGHAGSGHSHSCGFVCCLEEMLCSGMTNS